MNLPKLTSEQQQRVEENMGLVGGFIRRYPPPHYIPMEDYHQELSIGLCRAAATWSDDGGCQFSTWAFHQFLGIRSASIRKYVKPAINEKQAGEEVGFSNLQDREEVLPGNHLSPDQSEFIRRIFFSLCIDEQDMLLGRMTIREIGERIGISHQAVQHRKMKLVERLRKKMSSVFSDDWRREEGFFRMGFDLRDTMNAVTNEGELT